MFWYINGALQGSLVILFAWFERLVLPGAILLSVLFFLSNVVRFQIAHGEFDYGCFECVIGAFIGLGVLAARSWTLYRIERTMASDQKRYDTAWNEMIPINGSQDQLRSIEIISQGLNRHRSEPRQAESSGQLDWAFESRPQDKVTGIPLQSSPEIQSLDQLYATACVVYPLLIKKVQKLAMRCHGHFPLQISQEGTSCIQWSTIKQDLKLRNHVRWANLKPVDRAIEKLARCYTGEVSRLLDVCRQSIIFEELSELLLCMEMIAKDTDIEVLRVKNRLRHGYDGRLTAGFRSLVMSIRIVTEETRALHADGHCSELQLVPKTMFALNDPQGHPKYISFRNSQGDR